MTNMNNFLSDIDNFYSSILPMLSDTNQDQDPTVLVSVQDPHKKLFLPLKRLTSSMSSVGKEFICRGYDVQVS